MERVSGFPFIRLEFDKNGQSIDKPGTLALDGITDLIVLSHGWKNDEQAAEALYSGILQHLRTAAGDDLETAGRSWAAVGVIWPALLFRPDLSIVRPTMDEGDGDNANHMAAGSAAASAGDDLAAAELEEYAFSLGNDLDVGDAEAFADLAREAVGGGGAADDFLVMLRSLLSADDVGDAKLEHAELMSHQGRELAAAERDGGEFPAAAFSGNVTVVGEGGAAAFERFRETTARLRSGGAAAIARLLNQGTYYEMKSRAGNVGVGLARVLRGALPAGLRIHLVGHSFGARLVTAAAAAPGARPVASLSLLQGAFSHNAIGSGFGADEAEVGVFRQVVSERRVAGPILVTHTHRDTAVGFFYAIASAASGTIASSFGLQNIIGGPGDLHGGLGANGALSLRDGEAHPSVAAAEGALPDLIAGKVNNVLADAIVSDHNDVVNARVGGLVWKAVDAAC